MKVALDLNVVLDVVQNRQPHYQDSADVVSRARTGDISALLPGHAITTLYYILAKATGKAKAGLESGRFGLLYPEAAPEELSLETTENLKDWRRVQTFTPTNATWLWDEETASQLDRFFRVVPASTSSR